MASSSQNVSPLHFLPTPETLPSRKLQGLILLDVNGVLCAKIPDDRVGEVPKEMLIKLSTRSCSHAITRPGIAEVIADLTSRYNVAIYSSTRYTNLTKMLKGTLGGTSKFAFIADRSTTTLHPEYGVDPRIKDFDTIKPLENIFQHPIFNENRKWGPHNTILVDNDQEKMRSNDPRNTLVVPEFTLDSYLEGKDDVAEFREMVVAKMTELITESVRATIERNLAIDR